VRRLGSTPEMSSDMGSVPDTKTRCKPKISRPIDKQKQNMCVRVYMVSGE